LKQLRRDSCVVSDLARHLETRGWTAIDTKMNICPFIDLRGSSWESYLATLGSSHRYNFNRRLKYLEKNYELGFEILKSPDAARHALDILISLHHERWRSSGTSEAFQSGSIVAFHQDFVELAAKRGWLRILVLRLNKAPVAALYGLRYGQTFSFYQSGFD